MLISARQPFHFWRFFFSLKGRVTRLPFTAFILPCKLFFLGTTLLLDANVYGTHSALTFITAMSAFNILKIFNILLLWPIFSVTFKRLHDIGLSGLFSLIWLAPVLANAAVFVLLIRATSNNPFIMLPVILKYIFFYTLWIFTLALVLWPGTKGPNKYAPDPRQPDMDTSDIF